jgi:hypothetical protein
VALNDGGESQARLTLHLVPRPPRVVVEELRSPRTGRAYRPVPGQNDGQGRAVIDEVVTEGRVELHGRIYWSDRNDERFRHKIAVRVSANEFQQLPVTAQPPEPGAMETTFTATVLLTREKHNVIEIDLPEVPKAGGQRNACVVRHCAKPIQGRRLHLVVVGIGEKNGQALMDRALAAIGAKNKKVEGAKEQWQAPPAFETVVPYEPLVGDVWQDTVFETLRLVKRRIQDAAAEAGKDVLLGEVVLLYYQGQEIITPKGHFLLTDQSTSDTNPERSGVSCEKIVELFSDTPGAQVVMLDMKHQPGVEARAPAAAFKGTRVGLLHSYWPGEKMPATRLLGLVQQGWGDASTLGNLAQQVEALGQRLAPQLRFDKNMPAELALLEFGGKR